MTTQRIQASLRFNYAQLDRRPRAPRKDPDPTERARLQNRIAELRADLHRTQVAAPAPPPAVPPRRPRKVAPPDPTDLFPAFAQAEAEEDEQSQIAARKQQIEEHRRSMKFCWPDWTGPLADGSGTSGFCEVHSLTAHSLTHGEHRYHYMAACRIESISPDGLTLIVVVEYAKSVWCSDLYNGERLRLDITDVWPPCQMLRAERHERELAATDNQQPTHAAPAAHPWDTGDAGRSVPQGPGRPSSVAPIAK